MHILEISFVPPDKHSGGGLGIFQSIFSLAQNAEVDYIGPEFDEKLFERCTNKVNVVSKLEPEKCFTVKRIFRFIINKISTSYFDSWKTLCSKIEWSKYDAVHIESSRYYFALRECRYHCKKIIVRMHNVEYDYGYNIMKESKRISDFVRWVSFSANEKRVVKNSDILVFLTSQDIDRTKELYSVKCDNSVINPVCLSQESDFNIIDKRDEEFRILLTGSLDYLPNVIGIKWFLENVWNELKSKKNYNNMNVTIAGKNPSKEFTEYISAFERVTLVNTPVDITTYFKNADVYVAPIFHGAGMKVKVAEALSYGLPVIGTDHAFIGYEQINKGLYLSNSKEEFILHIENMCNNIISTSERKQILQQFQNCLSLKTSCVRYRIVLEKVTKL